MIVTVNGEDREFEADISVAALVKSVCPQGERVAVELNRKVLRKRDWESTPLGDGDSVEVVHFVGGG
jgi:thiamine biosynthesis protein ThiS